METGGVIRIGVTLKGLVGEMIDVAKAAAAEGGGGQTGGRAARRRKANITATSCDVSVSVWVLLTTVPVMSCCLKESL